MFLIYRSHGMRRYGENPLPPHARNTWSYNFFLKGACTVVVANKGVLERHRIQGPTLLAASPECIHGWDGTPEDEVEMVVFQFDDADTNVRSVLGSVGWSRLAISEDDAQKACDLYDRCEESQTKPGFLSRTGKNVLGPVAPLVFTIVAAEVALLFLRYISRRELAPTPEYGLRKVNEALSWYESNLSSNPTIKDICRAVHVSPTHLRRLFHRYRGTSPKDDFKRVQFEHVELVMRNSGISIEWVAQNCGFGSACAFSRAFKLKYGVSPRGYRAKLRAELEAEKGS